MTAHLYKRGAADARLTFRCPWCDIVCASAVLGVHEHRADAWLLVACAHFACGRGVLIRVPNATPWPSLQTSDDGLLLASSCVMPSRPA
jgi:hypothetical protein